MPESPHDLLSHSNLSGAVVFSRALRWIEVVDVNGAMSKIEMH